MSGSTPTEVINDLATRTGATVSSAIAPFVETLAPELLHFMEVGLVLEPTCLSVITLGSGQGFAARVTSLLEHYELGDDPARAVDDLQRTIDSWMLARVGGERDDRPEFDLYFRRPMHLDHTVSWLAQHGVNEAERQALVDLGRLAGTERTGVFGASFRRGQPPLFKAYVHVQSTERCVLGDRLYPLFEHFRIPGEDWPALLAGIDGLRGGPETDAYVSLLLGDGDAFDSLKLDLFHVDLDAFTHMTRERGLASEDAPSVAELGRSMGMSCAEHCGFRFDDQGATRLSVYLSSGLNLEISP